MMIPNKTSQRWRSRFSRRWMLISVLIILVSVLSAALALREQVFAAWQPDPVTTAWARARASGSYHFSSDILQQTIPSTIIANVGRASRMEQFRLEGQTDLRAQSMEMQLWSDEGSVLLPESGVAIRIVEGKTWMRRGAAPWQEQDDFTEGLAPQGDFMGYLAAVKDVVELRPEQRAGIVFTRYAFRIDGASYAAFVRDRMEEALRQKGELPPGVQLTLPTYYRDMTGDGELWVGENGLPLRQLLNLRFPEQNNETVYTQIKVDFSHFGRDTISSPQSPALNLGGWTIDFGLRTRDGWWG